MSNKIRFGLGLIGVLISLSISQPVFKTEIRANQILRRVKAGEVLPQMAGLTPVNRIGVLAQRVTTERGQFTGFWHIDDAIRAGISGIIAGHSEAQKNFQGEDYAQVNKQIKAAIERKLKTIIMCVGEEKDTRAKGIEEVKEVLETQLLAGFKDLSAEQVSKLNIAYEPKWSIGTGLIPTPEEAREMHDFIRGVIKQKFGSDAAQKIRILYGGSVKAANARSFMESYDGLLVAGAFTKTEEAVAIAKVAQEIGPKNGRLPLVTGNLKTYEIEDLAGLANALKKLDPQKVELALAPDPGSVKDISQQVKGWFIDKIEAKTIYDSRMNKTVRVVVTLEDGTSGDFSVPGGASLGSLEPKVLPVDQVPAKVAEIMQKLKALGVDLENQYAIDEFMRQLDGTPNFSRLGGNTVVGVSNALAKAVSNTQIETRLNPPRPLLWRYQGKIAGNTDTFIMPVPCKNVINGGAHGPKDEKGNFLLDIQEFMLMIDPGMTRTYAEREEMGEKVFKKLKEMLTKKGLSTAVGDEGGFAPKLNSNKEAIDLVVEAIKQAGYKPGIDIAVALDVAATTLWEKAAEKAGVEADKYQGGYFFEGETRTNEYMIDYYKKLVNSYIAEDGTPIIRSIEDGMSEFDWAAYGHHGWEDLTREIKAITQEFAQAAGFKGRIQLVLDDIDVTNLGLTKRLIAAGIGTDILIKLNQNGTLSGAIEVVKYAGAHGYGSMISHRSGETPDTTIADLVVALSKFGALQIKSGSSRGERTTKYNRLREIEEERNALIDLGLLPPLVEQH